MIAGTLTISVVPAKFMLPLARAKDAVFQTGVWQVDIAPVSKLNKRGSRLSPVLVKWLKIACRNPTAIRFAEFQAF
jgi:hypothetical protein